MTLVSTLTTILPARNALEAFQWPYAFTDAFGCLYRTNGCGRSEQYTPWSGQQWTSCGSAYIEALSKRACE